jgi:hypothetical protein
MNYGPIKLSYKKENLTLIDLNVLKKIIGLSIVFASHLSASPLPCTVWQIKVKSHVVRTFKKVDGTIVSKTNREEHCREKWPELIKWKERFINSKIKDWPESQEKFKPWQQSEKEIILELLNHQPQVFKDLNVNFFRGVLSKYNKNPGSSVKILEAIALYDIFFQSPEKSRVLSHELSHLYLHSLNKKKLSDLVYELGWRRKIDPDEVFRLPNYPLLKSDSSESLTEDIANHLEDYLHDRENLSKNFPKRYKLLKELLPSDFKIGDS